MDATLTAAIANPASSTGPIMKLSLVQVRDTNDDVQWINPVMVSRLSTDEEEYEDEVMDEEGNPTGRYENKTRIRTHVHMADRGSFRVHLSPEEFIGKINGAF